MTKPSTGGHDKGHKHDIEIGSDFKLEGVTTPSGASLIPQIMAGDDENLQDEEMRVLYSWGDRTPGLEDMHWSEARKYLDHATDRSSNAQPPEKWDDEMYLTRAPEEWDADYIDTNLPNPEMLRADGDIEVEVNYEGKEENGVLGISIEFDTRYEGDDDDELSEGKLTVKYEGVYGQEADNEIQRMSSFLKQAEKVERLLE